MSNATAHNDIARVRVEYSGDGCRHLMKLPRVSVGGGGMTGDGRVMVKVSIIGAHLPMVVSFPCVRKERSKCSGCLFR